MDGSFDQPKPEAAFKVELVPDISARRALLTIERSCVEQIRANEAALEKTWSADALHQIRVALRRWRTALAAFRDVESAEDKASVAELKWLAGELDEARDLDVFAHSYGSRPGAEDPKSKSAAFDNALARAHAGAHDRAIQALQSDRWRRFLWAATGNIAAPVWAADDGPSARDLAAKALRHHARKVRDSGRRLGKLGPNARHRLRIQAKKARYTAEVFCGLFGHPRRQKLFIKALRGLQGSLGDLNDIHVAEGLARRLTRDAKGAGAARTGGWFTGSKARRQAALLRQAGKAYDRFVEVDPFW